jgi:membrane protein DedA with SNARE-associated domain
MAWLPGGEAAQLIDRFGYVGVGVTVALESLGAPVPGESLLIAAAAYAEATGRLDIHLLVACAAAGAILGDQIGYLIGRWVGSAALVRWGGRIGLTPDRLELARWLFARYGGPLVAGGRFIAVLRTIVALLAGANRMPWHSFAVWNVAGGIAWTASWGYGTWLLGDAIGRFHQLMSGPVGIAGMIAGLAAALWFLFWVRRNEARLLARARVEMASGPGALPPGPRRGA